MKKHVDNSPAIEPYGFYSVAWFAQNNFSARYISALRAAGLKAVGDMYIGIDIIEAHRAAAKSRQRVSGKEGYEEGKNKNKPMDKKDRHPGCRLQSISGKSKSCALESQLEKIG